ncbi:putative cytochrome P450 [Colletotrichum karsti]|uniref:Cytochrome P450 n=1 Tax=Colletotrichum karsti TaxID=1095194 RepID=A0A9P6IB32_9PEZI|nr:putative cytochrome P450 [Colletotrichum karsti]KAF9880403.1 putative cytochrome P450 [Colletotrichum karsti]
MSLVGIPRAPPTFLLGNFPDLVPSNPWPSFKKLQEKNGEIFYIKVPFKPPVVFVASAALLGELCDEKRFRKQVTKPILEIRGAVHVALFTAGYEGCEQMDWGIAHRIIRPQLTPQVIAESFGDFLSTADDLFDIWRKKGPGAEIFPITELDRLNLEATTLALFGKRLDCLERSHEMLGAMATGTGEATQRPNRPLPFQNWWTKGDWKKSIQVMRKYAQDLVDYRRSNPTDRKDLLDAMMNGTDPKSGAKLDDEQVVDEIVSMPIGSSTAPCVIAAAIYFLLRNKEAVAKAREEIDAVVGDDELAYEHVAQLKYVEGIIREALRLSFAAPGFNIEPIHEKDQDTGPVQLAGGKYQIPYNQGMIVLLAGANRDPAVFDKPNEFRPERMVGEKYEQLPLGARRYYGNGKRVCVGKDYAWLWKMVVMTKLIKEFDFEAVDKNYELEQEGWFNMRPKNFRAKIKPRTGTKGYPV